MQARLYWKTKKLHTYNISDKTNKWGNDKQFPFYTKSKQT